MLKNKKNLYFGIILFCLIAIVFYYFYPKRYADITWPRSSTFEKSTDKDISIILNEPFEAYNGKWPLKTNFFIADNEVREIEVFSDFTFYYFKFKKGAIIALKEEEGEQIHEMFIKAPVKIDGLHLHGECVIEFKKGVLYSARCPEFNKVYFKRFITPKALDYNLESSTQEG